MDGLYHKNIAAALSLVCLLLIPLLVYFPVLRSEYVAYDDELLIVDNVKAQGLTWEHVQQAFTTYDPELYIPLTLLTEQIEYSIVGHWSSAVSHGISLGLHLLNVLLVYWLMRLLLRACHIERSRNATHDHECDGSGFNYAQPDTHTMTHSWVPLLCALLFALHPLNVETVAWAAARKDLLSGFFFLLSVCGYLKMTRSWYWFSIIAFLFGLLAKVSIAPLPLVLLLLERFFPLHPLPFKGEGRVRVLKRVSPYFLLSIVFVTVALLGKKAQVHAFGATLLAPFVAIPFYLQKFLIPTGLSILYPFTEELSLMHPSVLLGIAVVSGLTLVSWWSLRWTRSVACAYGIFLLLLAPSFLNVARRGDGGIIDLVTASDRYMYLAMLGPLMLLGMLCASHKWLRCALLPVLGVFAFLTVRQVGVWHDSEALFRNVLEQHQTSHIAANNLAGLLARKGETSEAMQLYQQSITMRENPRALFNMGRLLLSEKRFSEALPLFKRYVAMKPHDAFGRMQLGGLLLLRNDIPGARLHLEKAVQLDSALPEAHYLLGVTYERLGESTKARQEFQETFRLKPDHPYALGKID